MDRASNPQLRYCGRSSIDERYARLIYRIAQTRGLDIEITRVDGNGEPTLRYDTLEIRGAWPIISYLTERYPEPELLPGDCTQRALIRSLTTDLIVAGAATGAFARVRDRNSFIFGQTPSLLDLAYITVTESDHQWRDLHDRFFAYVLNTTLEACIEDGEDDEDDDRDLRFTA